MTEEERQEELEWQREMAMEAGMLHGVDAYNEAMGCEVQTEGPWDWDY